MSKSAKREVSLGVVALAVAVGVVVHGVQRGPDPVRPVDHTRVTGVGDLGAPVVPPNPIAGLTNPAWRTER